MLTIGAIRVGSPFPCRFVAEISNAHNGSFTRAVKLIDAAQALGADLVKFQAYTPDELIALRGDGAAPEPWGAQGWTMRSLYLKAQTPLDWFPKLAAHCKRVGMPWFSSVFGAESLAMLEGCDCPAYKIARLDNTHRELLEMVTARGKPVLVSASDASRLSRATNSLIRGESTLYCAPGYPTPPRDMQLPVFLDPDGYVYYLGLSSHCLDPRLPIAAVARGAKLIEMHLQLDDEPSELEADVSLPVTEYAQMIQDVRAVEVMLAQ